jgi:hypothetical protein
MESRKPRSDNVVVGIEEVERGRGCLIKCSYGMECTPEKRLGARKEHPCSRTNFIVIAEILG